MYNKITLDNGLRIVTEYIPHVKSVSIGLWVEAGSRKEETQNNGVTHFIEHMLFKGTESRSAKDIAESIDNIGGQINAFTSKECTCYYAKVLDRHLSTAIEVLSDMFFNSKFDEEEILKEKGVVFEEIKMYEDSPEDLVYDLLSETFFENHPLGLPILGSNQTLSSLNKDDIIDYYKKHYTPENTVISLVGNFDSNEAISLIKNYFDSWESEKKYVQDNGKLKLYPKIISKKKDIEQLHFCLGMEGIPNGDDDLYPLLIANNVFGGGMSSRLFQTIREEKGLVYSIYSYLSTYKDTGLFSIYAGLNPDNLLTASKIIKNNIETIKKSLLSKEEILKSKEQLKGNYILGLESTSSRMTSIGKSELLLGKITSPQEVLDKIDNVSLNDIERVIKKVFDNSKYSITFVGNIKDEEKLKNDLEHIFF